MNEETYRLLYVFTDLILPLIVGYYLHRFNCISDRLNSFIIKFNVTTVYTLQTLLSFWVLPISVALFLLIPFSTLFVLLPGLIGALTFARKHKNMLNHGSYIMSAMLSNLGTLGGVCAFILYGEQGFAYTQIVASCQNFMLVMICFPLAQHYRNKFERKESSSSYNLKYLLSKFISVNQISVIGIALGLLFNFYGIPRPQVFGHIFTFLVHFGAWTALIPVGYLINFSKARYYYSRVWDLALMHFVIVPVIIYIAAKMLFDNEILLNTLMICAITPTAINAVIASRLYRLNVNLAVASFMMTTAMFLCIIFPILFFVIR